MNKISMQHDKLTLPIDAYLDEILQTLTHAQTQNLIIVAQPGAGKTTRLPPALLKILKNEILVLEPRRVAAVAAADRIAIENNWQLGQEVGYHVRFDKNTSPKTRITFMTEALLARRMLHDPQLKNVDAVVLDEFHERSLHVDLALGFLRELQLLGRDIKIIVMSATLDAKKISEYLGDARVVNVPGKLHPMTIEHIDKSPRLFLDNQFYSSLTQKIYEVAKKATGDTLVFLPGAGEIERTHKQLLQTQSNQGLEIQTLHGTMNLAEQKRVLQRSQKKRIILATNLAESALTIDGVTAVVDSGLAKVMRVDLNTGFSRLELSRISLSSAEQRAGRSARQAPGLCYKMWSRQDETQMKKYDTPEILRSDLSESLLFLAASPSGVQNPHHFTWFEKPKDAAIDKAWSELIFYEAINGQGEITPHGREMSQLPLPPKLSHFLILCARHGQAESGAQIAALLQERDILKPGAAEHHLGDNIENDLLLRLDLLTQASRHQYHQVRATADALLRLLAHIKMQKPLTLDEVILLAFSNQLCRRRQKSEKARMVGGRGVKLSKDSIVKTSEFFIALNAVELPGTHDTVVSLAYGLDKKTVLHTLKDKILETDELIFDEDKGQLYNCRALHYLDLPLEEGRLSQATQTQNEQKLIEFLAHNLEYVKKHNDNFAHFCERLAAYNEHASEPLQIGPNEWIEIFQMAATGEKKLEDIISKNLIQFIENVVDAESLAKFNRAAPSHFTAPTGSKFKINYPTARAPFVEVRLQELFGTKENPKLFEGALALQFHLLGPNYRPQQVTSDILSFWQNTYPEVRNELRTRYPKHSWPENPLDAPAVKKGRSVKANA